MDECQKHLSYYKNGVLPGSERNKTHRRSTTDVRVKGKEVANANGHKREEQRNVKRYTQRAKQGVLRKRVLLPPGLKAKRSEPQLNFTQPEEGVGRREREREEKSTGQAEEVKKTRVWREEGAHRKSATVSRHS